MIKYLSELFFTILPFLLAFLLSLSSILMERFLCYAFCLLNLQTYQFDSLTTIFKGIDFLNGNTMDGGEELFAKMNCVLIANLLQELD